MRNVARIVIVTGLLLAPVAGTVAAAPAGAAGCIGGFSDAGGGICTADFVMTGAPASFTLPPNVASIDVVVSGAQGGVSREEQVDPFGGAPSPGGQGGRETATVPVTAGGTVTVVVGQQGGSAQNAGTGNYGGGYGGGGSPSSNYGGGGGGGSFVWDATDPVNGPVLLAAAGGGGGGGYDYNPVARGSGDQQNGGGAGAGAGDAVAGQSVAFCCDPSYNTVTHYPAGGGGGATATAGGAGGVPQLPASYAFGQVAGDPGSGPASAPESPGQGGRTYNGCCYFVGWAGGGGGGYFGGGGGGNIEADLEGGGGGGGSGYVTPGATNAIAAVGVQSGDGLVTVSYDSNAVPPPPITVSKGLGIGDATVVEGDTGAHALVFPVTLPAPATAAVSVPYSVTGAGATWGSGAKVPNADYGGKASGTISFPLLASGRTAVVKYVSIPVFGDAWVEGTERLTVSLGTPTGPVPLGRSTAIGTILDDDVDPSLRVGVGDASIVEGDSGTRSVKLTVTLTHAPGAAAVTVPYAITGTGGATWGKSATTPGADFGGKSAGTLTFTGTAVTKVIAIPVYGDTAVDPAEGVTVTLGAVNGATVIRSVGTATILDDD